MMGSRVSELRPLFVEYFPDEFESGILYVSMQYAICGHLCACGCGEKVITPLSPKQWKIAYNGEDVTLYPSIGNYAFSCQSHYFLTKRSSPLFSADAESEGLHFIMPYQRYTVTLFCLIKYMSSLKNSIFVLVDGLLNLYDFWNYGW